AVSPDGHTIAFMSNRNGNLNVFSMNEDGGDVKQLTEGLGDCRLPTWSPDGSRIAFQSMTPKGFEIYVMDADGSNPVRLTHFTGHHADPAWSPDGARIAFASLRDGQKGYRVLVMDADGKNVRVVSPKSSALGYVYPAWSPDGLQIAYGMTVGDGVELFVCELDGSNQRQLTQLGGLNCLPAWSPDGLRIAFTHTGSGEEIGSLYLVNTDGTNPTVILRAAGPSDEGRPAWIRR